MHVLGIETSGEMGSVGIISRGKTLAEINFAATLKQGEKLFPAVDSALKLAEIDKTELGLISVATGPGSFTGLRIGIASAKGMAQALEIPLVGVPSFDIYTSAASYWGGKIWALLPDRKDWIYTQCFKSGQMAEAAQAVLVEHWLQRIGNEAQENMFFIGPGAESHRKRLESIKGAIVAPQRLNEPSGTAIAKLGLERFDRDSVNQIRDIEPLYLQALMPDTVKPAKTTKIIQFGRS
ncbi:tRNA (adenosine(37)-N6)-threonylcarbamoyltransferase complex dimerization subunit type 1 TsaB [Candidatus Acetothermia bacterium]|nr:tRNA (adenosine(37)-N6)-threonylcarbamoyltransferase complex dimerization subunit type 1 TsaB [Candidatus Acetothermia bacterium]MBI3643185.1 tRNA (adenosine(37)-N6)-threonylcarbamoyltransferase complex dimerization subunit type 1 TsaB [Candidatus Acetothermia bacterium]